MAKILYFFIQYSPKLTPQGTALLDKLMLLQLIKNFHSLMESKGFFSVCKSAKMVLLSQKNWLKPSQPAYD